MTDDSDSGGQTTLVAGVHSGGSERLASAAALLPTLTVLHHGDRSLVGATCRLVPSSAPRPCVLSRAEPLFSPISGASARPLGDPHLSRKASLWLVSQADACTLEAGPSAGGLRVDGLPFDGVQEISSEELQRGVVLSLNDRVLLLLHSAPELRLTGPDFDLIGRGQAMFATRAAIGQVADLDVPVLIRGESGTGKELVARALHLSSPRHRGPFVAVNMGAINPSTALSELFGHIKGAFTGANSDRVGLFSQADGGTLFLDEIGEAPAEVQVMLLRCLEDGLIRPVGSDQPRSVDVRVVAATDRDLELATQDGTFRGPLLHRLSGFQIPLAPLRSRREDLGLLLHTFLHRELSRLGTPDQLARPLSEVLWLRAQLVERLVLADWPGNVRQLANVARQIVIGSRGLEAAQISDSLLAAQESPAAALAPVPMPGFDEATPSTARVRPEELQESSLLSALREEGFVVAAAARRLGISRTSLYALMEKSPNVRKARDLTEVDIRAALDGGAHELRAAALQLEVSERGLRLRMTELGLH